LLTGRGGGGGGGGHKIRTELKTCFVLLATTQRSQSAKSLVAAKHPFTSTSTINPFWGGRFPAIACAGGKVKRREGEKARRREAKTGVKGKKERTKPAQTTVGHVDSPVRGKAWEGASSKS
jgi:hypothetical protein